MINFYLSILFDSKHLNVHNDNLFITGVNDEIIAVIEKVVNKVFGAELRTKIDQWIEAHKAIVVEAVKDGAQALYELIKSHWADIIGMLG